MFATAVKEPFSSSDWIFELKLDGFRAIAETGDDVQLYSRNGLSFKNKFPVIVQELGKLRQKLVLDGEIVLMNEENKPDFQKLQHYEGNRHLPLIYYVFDLLFINGKDITQESLLTRKRILKKAIGRNKVIKYCDHVEKDGEQFYNEIAKLNMEGIIAKRCDSVYVPGVRSKEWLKIKNHQSQEAIIVGYTEPKGSRKHFGSILLAEYNDNDELIYIGHAGTGFNHSSLSELMQKMKPYVTKTSPVKKKIVTNGPVTWLKPILVCEVSYSEVTRDGMLRHPVFKVLRPEKKAKNIRKATELPQPVEQLLKRKK